MNLGFKVIKDKIELLYNPNLSIAKYLKKH